jgi:hypothetical protein
MEGFTFHSVVAGPLQIAQEVTGKIGFKIYPGALELARYLETNPLPRGSTVLELGAGVCALPGIVCAHTGSHVVSTDVPEIVPLLAENIQRNTASLARAPALAAGPEASGSGGSCSAAALTWGEASHIPPVVERIHSLRASSSSDTSICALDYIIAADVVYHEPLIQPFLDALVALTDPLTWTSNGSGGSPVILLAYVQRFKRAKQFFKLAKRYFDIETIGFDASVPLPSSAPAPPSAPSAAAAASGAASAAAVTDAPAAASRARDAEGEYQLVVDYDALSWTLPVLAAERQRMRGEGRGEGSGEGPARVSIRSDSALYSTYLKELAEIANAPSSTATARSSSNGEKEAPLSTTSTSTTLHGIDSDSEDEWENNALYAQNLLSSLGGACEQTGEASSASAESGAASDSPASADAELRRAAAKGAARLGVPFTDPLKAYLYVLRRKRKVGK